MALANVLSTNVRYGIFESFLHRSVLWQRAQNIPLGQINFAAGKAPPSWSWMAYHGQIEYITPISIDWDKSVQIVNASRFIEVDYVLETRVRRLQNCEIKPEGVIYDKEHNEVGNLHFDTQLENVPLEEIQCAIIGRELEVKDEKRKYYVLFVTSRGNFGEPFLGITGSRQLKFRRVGAGIIQKRFILFSGQDDTAWIV
jgi:hypothetical protein